MPKPHRLKNPDTGCRNPQQYFGEWMIEAERLETLKEHAYRFDLSKLIEAARLRSEAGENDDSMDVGGPGEKKPEEKKFLFDNGVAIFQVNGPTLKYPDSFDAGTSTVKLERQIRLAMADPDVKRGLLRLEDAPGGSVAGAFELRDAIEQFAKAKPMEAMAIDLCCSAAYLFASACDKITANPTAYIGSIGVISQLKDTSGAFDKAGVKVIPLATGKHKGTGMPGVPITDEQVAARQSHVDQLYGYFVDSVARHRKIDAEAIKNLEAGIFLANKAQEIKLIDAIDSFENVLNRLKSECEMERAKENALPSPYTGSANMNLLEQLKAILGDQNLTQEQAAAKIQALLSANAKLTSDLASANESIKGLTAIAGKAELPELTEGRLDLTCQRADIAVANGLPVTASTKIKAACGASEKEGAKGTPNAFMLAPRAELGGKNVGEWAIGLFEGNPAPEANVKDGAKTKFMGQVTREIPGSAKVKDADKEHQEAIESADAEIKRMGLKPVEVK
jgi:signal peptide peptidase SppA